MNVAAFLHFTSRNLVVGAFFAGALTVGSGLVGCGGADRPALSPKAPLHPLSSWIDVEAQLFDDGVDLDAIAHEDGATNAADNADRRKLVPRTDLADGILLVKVVAVSREPMGDKVRYRVEATEVGPPIGGIALDPPIFVIAEPGDPSFGMIRAADEKFIGQTVVLFYKRYAPSQDGDEPVVHFHLVANKPDALKLITDELKAHDVRG